VTIFLKGLEKIHECPEVIPEGKEKLGMDRGSGHVNGSVSAKGMKERLVVYGVRKHLTGQLVFNKMFSPATRFGFKRLSSPFIHGILRFQRG
jgi:hypothetical protein